MAEIDSIIEKCVGEELPPCKATCPLHVDAREYVDLIAQGKYDEALAAVHETLPFPGILGRICLHPCELKCRRGEKDAPISIASLKRFAADHGKAADIAVVPSETKKERIAIIGAGPAGLMAAYDLRKQGYRVTIFEALPFVGGMMRVGIPAWRLPRPLLEQETSILAKMGVELKLNMAVGKDVQLSDLRRDFDSVFIAVGAHVAGRLRIPGEESPGVHHGTEFLRQVHLGQQVEVGKRVVVIGGGNVAMDCARMALRLGAEEVTAICLESGEEMPAHAWEIEEAKEEGVKIVNSWGPTAVVVQEGRISGVEFQKCTSVFDSEKRFRPTYDSCTIMRLDCDTVIVAIGQGPDLAFVGDGEKKEGLQAGRLLAADPVTLQTGLKGVFAGGEVVVGPSTVIDSLAAGRKAAISVDRYLRGEDMSVGREGEGRLESKLAVNFEEVAPANRVKMPALPLEERSGFQEVELGYSGAEAKQEADRCLKCECKQCVKECEFLKAVCVAPKELAIKLNNGALRENPELVFSCNLCSLCNMVCPQELNVGKMCLDLRRQLVQEGVAPLAKHKPIVESQRWVTSDDFALTLPDPVTGDAQRFFFPGCNLSAYSPDLVVKTWEYLRTKLPGTGIILCCCGGPTHALGDQTGLLDINGRTISEMKKFGASELILACPHCYHIFKDYAPDVQVTSLYEVMAEQGLPEGAKCPSDKTFSLHDSCNTRHESQVQDAVRKILKDMGCNIQEPEFSKEMTRCCGMGGMIAYVDMKLANKVTMRRAKELPNDVLNYCASCRDSFAAVGKPSIHILDLVFGADVEKARKAPPKMGPAKQQIQTQLRERLVETK